MIGFSFASDWLRGWCEFSRPITERSKAKPMQSRITFDTQLKIALFSDVKHWSTNYRVKVVPAVVSTVLLRF